MTITAFEMSLIELSDKILEDLRFEKGLNEKKATTNVITGKDLLEKARLEEQLAKSCLNYIKNYENHYHEKILV